MFAYDYPILGLFWTMFIFFLWVAWIMLLFRVFGDIFTSDDLGGWTKGLWSIFVLFLPFLGVLIYVLVRGDSMARRDTARARARDAEFRAYVQETAGSGGTADELAKLSQLRDSGVLTDSEFAAQKAKLLA
jgi:hypothetical protein